MVKVVVELEIPDEYVFKIFAELYPWKANTKLKDLLDGLSKVGVSVKFIGWPEKNLDTS